MFWSAVLTKRGNENLALANIRAQGFSTYLPQIKDHSATKPLFPRFLFVRQNKHFHYAWPSLHNTRGCCGPLMSGDSPGKVRAQEIDRMREHERHGLIQLPLSFVPGQSLRIKTPDHLLHEHLVVFEGMAGKARAKVLWMLFGAMTSVTVDLSRLEAVV